MTREYLKKAEKTAQSDAADVRQTVQTILDEIERGGDEAARHYAAKFDQYDGNAVLMTQVRKKTTESFLLLYR